MNVTNVQQHTANPVICIPRVIGLITKPQVASIFKRLAWGKIENIVIVSSNKRSKQKSSKWGFSNDNSGSSSDMQWRSSQNNIIQQHTETESSCIFVHLNWCNSANIIKQKLLNKESIKLVCSEFEFWKLYAKNKTIK
tara:strand:- start:168 stop:581 length:414 start_codon:yes stop_codon:yes gene_type:complete